MLTTPNVVIRFFTYNSTNIITEPMKPRHLDLNNVIGENLNDKYKDFMEKDRTTDAHLDTIIQMAPPSSIKSSDFVTWRGILTQIMCFPFSWRNEDAIVLNAINVDGIIYIEHYKASQLETVSDPLQAYYGYRFETICMDNTNTDKQELVTDNRTEWIHVFSSSINDIRLLYGAEIDGLDENKQDLVELKTSKLITTAKDQRIFFEKKLMRSWAQSYLANVPHIVYGFRDKDGVLKEVKRYATLFIPSIIKGCASWDPNTMMIYLYDFLIQIKKKLGDKPGIVFRIVLNPSQKHNFEIFQTSIPNFVRSC